MPRELNQPAQFRCSNVTRPLRDSIIHSTQEHVISDNCLELLPARNGHNPWLSQDTDPNTGMSAQRRRHKAMVMANLYLPILLLLWKHSH